MTVLVPDLADVHEATPGATCLTAPDGDTCCHKHATHRVELVPLPGYETGPVTFVCREHLRWLGQNPAVLSIRKVRP
jgi:hypothetical protein